MNQTKLIKFLIFIPLFLIFTGLFKSFLAGIAVSLILIFIIFNRLNLESKFRSFASGRQTAEGGERKKVKNMIDQNFAGLKNLKLAKGLLAGAAVIIILIILLARMIIVIPAGNTGVVHLFGQVKDAELSSGLHLINPFAQVTKISIRTEEYTMTIIQGEGRVTSADSITALTKEGLTVDLDITVLYHLIEDKASDIFKLIGLDYDAKVIRPEIRSAIRQVIAQYEAKDLYSAKREEATLKIQEVLEKNIEPRGIEMEQVLLRDIRLPDKLAASIQEKLTAEQESQRYDFVLEKEKKEAERKVIEAEGQRNAQKIINESLSDRYLQYLYIRELKDRQGTIYVPTSPDNGLPLFRNIP